jgi:D-alanyl-lipoteichoic acid acyltransferase DltB (MBOAT superfamily)
MSFVDIRFLVFLPVVTAVYYLLPERFRWLFLLVSSYVFYMAWKPEYGVLLLCITAIDYACALRIADNTDKNIRRAWLLVSFAANLGILFFFKYFNFVLGSYGAIAHALGSGATVPVLDVLLPIGISFHVFQSLSYTIEVYRGSVRPTTHFGKLALYVSFFPQLVAGPIERPTHLLNEILEGRRFDLDRARRGTKLILWGFFKKLVIADNLAPAVNAAFAAPDQFSGPSLMIAAAMFSYQIYCDFSGYTDIARGVATLFGYELVLNFNRPYASRSVAEFWRRWHISLSSWFRDYVYIPLGGSRVSSSRRFGNLLVTFLLSGLWHGAAWTFVIWGALNALYMIISDITRPSRSRITQFVFRGPLERLHVAWQIICTFSIISVTWVFFRATDLASALYMIGRFGTGLGSFASDLLSLSGIKHAILFDTSLSVLQGVPIALVGIVILETIDYMRAHGILPRIMGRLPRTARLFAYSAATVFVLVCGQFATSVPFIYFQF